MLSLEHIEVSIGGSQILRGVSFHVPPGSVTCLMGRNGVGKTTTLRTITGLLKHSRGNVLLDGVNISKLPPEERARAGIGYVPQGREIFPHLSVEENLHIGCVARGKSAWSGFLLFSRFLRSSYHERVECSQEVSSSSWRLVERSSQTQSC